MKSSIMAFALSALIGPASFAQTTPATPPAAPVAPVAPPAVTPSAVVKQLLQEFAKLNLSGTATDGESSRRGAGKDFGNNFALPAIVVVPKSTSDIQKTMLLAKKHNLKVTMRGIGGAAYGQTLWSGGIAIDSSAFNKVTVLKDKDGKPLPLADIRPGALWSEVLDETIKSNLTPPVLPDTLQITVGGTLSVGGIGETSYRLGAQVDHVTELDIVTPDGKLRTCSPTQNADLFHLALGGMGQFGIIVRARIDLVQAPAQVQVRTVTYAATDMAQFLADQATIAAMEGTGAIAGDFNKNADGTWTPVITVTSWGADASNPGWLTSIKGSVGATVQKMSGYDYMNRGSAVYLAGQASGSIFYAHPYLAFFLPASTSLQVFQEIFADPAATLGAGQVATFPEDLQKFGKLNSFSIPSADKGFAGRIYRKSPQGANLQQMLDSNSALVQKILDAGGTVYMPFSPLLSTPQREQQFGTEKWERMKAEKALIDPTQMLAPGVRMFDPPPSASAAASKCETSI